MRPGCQVAFPDASVVKRGVRSQDRPSSVPLFPHPLVKLLGAGHTALQPGIPGFFKGPSLGSPLGSLSCFGSGVQSMQCSITATRGQQALGRLESGSWGPKREKAGTYRGRDTGLASISKTDPGQLSCRCRRRLGSLGCQPPWESCKLVVCQGWRLSKNEIGSVLVSEMVCGIISIAFKSCVASGHLLNLSELPVCKMRE